MGSRIVAVLLSVLTLMVLAGCGESYTEYGGIVQSVDLENQIIYVVSDMPEMRRVIDAYGIGAVLAAPGPDALADAVEQVLARPKADYDFAAARADFDWNREKTNLITLINNL